MPHSAPTDRRNAAVLGMAVTLALTACWPISPPPLPPDPVAFEEDTGSTNLHRIRLALEGCHDAELAIDLMSVVDLDGLPVPYTTTITPAASGAYGSCTLDIHTDHVGWLLVQLPRADFRSWAGHTENPFDETLLTVRYYMNGSHPVVSILDHRREPEGFDIHFSEEVRLEVRPEEALLLYADGRRLDCEDNQYRDSDLPLVERSFLLHCPGVPDAIAAAPAIFADVNGQALLWPPAEPTPLQEDWYSPVYEDGGIWVIPPAPDRN